MFNFCIKADGALAASFEGCLQACGRLAINNLETDDVIGGVRLSQMDGRATERCRRLLIKTNKKIVLLDSTLPLEDREQYRMLFRKAHLLGVENIRVDFGCAGDGKEPESCADDLNETIRMGKSYGIGVMLENGRAQPLNGEKPIAGLLRKAQGAGIIFNPLEFAATRRHPFFHVFYNCRWKPAIRFLRINDGLFADGTPSLPGKGNAEIKELASALLARSYRGYFSFSPYMRHGCTEDYEAIIRCFKKLLMEM